MKHYMLNKCEFLFNYLFCVKQVLSSFLCRLREITSKMLRFVIPQNLYSSEENLFTKDIKKGEKQTTINKNNYEYFSTLLEDPTQNTFNLSNLTTLLLVDCDIKQVPNGIQKLPLKNLSLARNHLVEIPVCLYTGLKELRQLDLSNNFIRNFDIEPACCMNLVTLKLDNNLIYNLPQWILVWRSTSLVELLYSWNSINNLCTKREVKIKKIVMRNCYLRNVDFPFFKRNRYLQHLDISNDLNMDKRNDFRNIDELFVKTRWNSLKFLRLDNLNVSIAPAGIFQLETITELYLKNCSLSWIPDTVQNLVNLQILDVSHNMLFSLPSQLAELENLKVIKAASNAIANFPYFNAILYLVDLYDNVLEEMPHFHDIGLVDFEQNRFNTADCENFHCYQMKKNRLRNYYKLDGERDDGPCERPSELIDEECDNVSDDKSSSDYSETNEEYSENNNNENDVEDDENWDCDGSKKVYDEDCDIDKRLQDVYEKNPLVADSDEEWQADEEINYNEKSSKLLDIFLDNEDILFCDAD